MRRRLAPARGARQNGRELSDSLTMDSSIDVNTAQAAGDLQRDGSTLTIVHTSRNDIHVGVVVQGMTLMPVLIF